jgi:hypothetical protein
MIRFNPVWTILAPVLSEGTFALMQEILKANHSDRIRIHFSAMLQYPNHREIIAQ